jgi:Transposase DDE domain
LARLEAWNQRIHRIRGRIEKIFGTWKRSYGLRRMRWRGLAKAGLQIRFTAIVYNIKRYSPDSRSGLTAANQRSIAPLRQPPSGPPGRGPEHIYRTAGNSDPRPGLIIAFSHGLGG